MKIATVLLVVCVVYCGADEPCSTPTDAETKCMEDAGRKNGADVVAHCTGVDFDALKRGDIPGSKICQFPACIAALGKDIYTPCNRSDLTMCVKQACNIPGADEPCSTPTDAETKCMEDAGRKNGADVVAHCTGVDFDALKRGDIPGSKICQFPACIAALGKDIYTPCNRSDLTMCVKQACNIPGTNCTVATSDQMQCMLAAAGKSQPDLSKYCSGVDLNLLGEGKWKESKVCDHPDCMKTLEKDLFTPCNRSDMEGCIRQVCMNPCSEVTEDEVKCMTDAASKVGDDLQKHCQGVDLDALGRSQINESHICSHMECIDALEKDLYTPCNRSDLGGCLKYLCKNSSCSAVTADELKCMIDAGTKHTEELKSCADVDFDLLKASNVKGSKVCDHPDCLQALDMHVYRPCRRSDLVSCIQSEC